MMKKFTSRIFTGFVLCCSLGIGTGLAQTENLMFNSYTDIAILDFETPDPILSYTGLSGFEAISHAEDPDGEVLFFIKANGVFRPDDTQMPGSVGLFADPSSAEMNICKVPGEDDQYYIFYQEFEACDPLYYSIVDMSLAGGLGDVISLNTLLDSNDHAEGMEIVRIPETNDFWFVAYRCYTGIDRYKVDASGISDPVMILDIEPLSVGFYDGRMELDYHEEKIAFGFNGKNQGFITDFDPVTGEMSNLITIDDINPYGAEFSPDGTKAYFTEWYDVSSDNLFQYDLDTGVLSSYQLLGTPCTEGANIGGLGQIELGADGNLYVIQDNGCGITQIQDSNTNSPVFVEIPVNEALALGISDLVQSDYFAWPFAYAVLADDLICAGAANGSITVDITIGTEPYEFSWSHDADKIGPTADGLAAGEYTVTISDNGGNLIEHTVTITETDPIYASSLIVPEVEGMDGSIDVTVSGGTPPYIYQWDTTDMTEDLEDIAQGTYKLVITDSNNCEEEVEFVVSGPAGVGVDEIEMNTTIATGDGVLHIQSEQMIKEVRIIDISGRILIEETVANKEFLLPIGLKNQLYLLDIEFVNGKQQVKRFFGN